MWFYKIVAKLGKRQAGIKNKIIKINGTMVLFQLTAIVNIKEEYNYRINYYRFGMGNIINRLCTNNSFHQCINRTRCQSNSR